MRFKEIIGEGRKLRKGAQHALPWAERYLTDPYTAYRLAVSVAGGPDFSETGPSPSFTTIPYTQAEQDMLDNARKKMGVSSKKLTKGNGSQELPDVNVQSPMTPKGPVKRKNK